MSRKPASAARALLAFVALPGIVAFAVPMFFVWRGVGRSAFQWPALVPLSIGTALLLWCVREFYSAGRGTLAPWDPPRHLVSSGPYRVSRNPMYVAVSLILLGWALGFWSPGLLIYAAAVMIAFHLRVVFHEEPWLARTFRTEWKQFSTDTPRWVFRSRRAVLIAWLIVALAFPIAGLAYEIAAEGAAAGEFPAPGTMVDVGGRRLHLLCNGEGEPTVFLESSGWGSAVSAEAVRRRLAGRTRVCSYDRSGNGWSDSGPSVVSAADLARDLAVLQDRAKISWPFVIVASSIGGLTAEMFARQFPERTAGLVFVDAANSLALPILESVSGRTTVVLCATSVLARFGVVRLMDPFGLNARGGDHRQSGALAYGPGPWGELCAMARGLSKTREAFDAAPPLDPRVPVAVLSASSDEDLVPPVIRRLVDVPSIAAAFRDSHQKLAQRSAHGTWEVVPESTHLIAETQPDAVSTATLALLGRVGRVGATSARRR